MEHIGILLLSLRGNVVLAMGFALAVWTTIHILLSKREVASAVGWIGLTWFAPLTGSVLYFVLGINRVQRRAVKFRARARRRAPKGKQGAEAALSQLQAGISRIAKRPLLSASDVRVFHNGDEGYPAMLAAIDAAERSVGLCSYIFRDDDSGGQFIEAVRRARDRGVEVLVLIDGVGGGYSLSKAYHHLRRENVKVARFMHSAMPWRMPFLNLRCHKKILVVDGKIGFTGGLNIADENVLAKQPKSPVQDTHFRLEGPVVAQLTENFLQDWNFATGETVDGPAWFAEDDGRNATMPARVVDAGPDSDVEIIEFAILEAVACARSSILVMTPYFLPDDRLITALSLASMRGVAVDVVIPQKSDHRLVDWASRPNIGPLLEDGARIWRSPPPFRHSKLMVMDGEWCLFGSSNWDIRSFRLNFEVCVEVYDRGLGETLTAEINKWRGTPLLQAELDGRALPIRLRDAAARLLLPYI